MVDLLEISNAADKILLAIENTFNVNAIALPARKYTTVGALGSVAYDCEQLTVSWQETYNGLPGNPQIGIIKPNCSTLHTGVFIVELVRPIAVSLKPDVPPEPALIQASADGLMKDAVLLHDAGLVAAEDSLLNGATVSVSAGDPSGGYQSIIMTVTMVI